MLNSLSHHELLVFWVQLLVLYSAARILGALARRYNLPSVIGELSAGLFLGPSLFGVLWPGGFDWFLPDSEVQSAMLLSVSWFSAAFLLVVAGFETDLDLIRRLGRAAALVTAGSIIVPFVGGLIVGWVMPDLFYGEIDGESPSRLVFTLFIAVSVAVSALAVVAKILGDLGLMRRDVGQITIAVGMANDLIGWIILGVIAGLAASGELSITDVSFTVIALGLFLVGAFVTQISDVLQDRRTDVPVGTLAEAGDMPIGVVGGSSFATYVEGEGAVIEAFGSQQEVFEAAEAGRVDLVVANPFALSSVGPRHGLKPTGTVFYEEFETFGLAQGSPWREPINRALADLQASGEIAEIVDRWLD